MPSTPVTSGSSRWPSRPTRNTPTTISGGSGATCRGPGWPPIYDRSWYGRVLVERLEAFASEPEWRRAYRELNEFERELVEHGVIVLKFWMHISKDEQLRRFRDREATAYKRHKMDREDWRNRRKWQSYEVAVGDMLALTSTHHAPWHLIAADNKRHARLEIIKTSCRQVEAALGI